MSGEFVITPEHLTEAVRARRPKLLPTAPDFRRRAMSARSMWWLAAVALLAGPVLVFAGAGWNAVRGSWVSLIATIPALLFLLVIGKALASARGRKFAEAKYRSMPWLAQPCRLEILTDSLRFTRESVEHIVPRRSVIAYDELSNIARLFVVGDEFLIPIETLTRDQLIQPLRNWIARPPAA
jgi:hypothetical protein